MTHEVAQQIETDRLSLRPYRSGDGRWLHEHYRRDQPHLAETVAGIQEGLGLDLTDPEEAERYVGQLQADWSSGRRFVFGVWERASGLYAGSIWIECRDWKMGFHELGYYVTSRFLGRGYATEAARAALAFIFHNLGASKAIVTCSAENVASYRVAERCGFLREGRLRQQLFRPDGGRVDQLVYGLLREEFEAATGSPGIAD